MLAKTLTTAAAVLSLATVTLAGATINTPSSLVECQPAQLSWTGGTAPYYLKVLPGGQTTATPLVQFDQTSSTTQTWTVNLAAGTAVSIALTDSTGAIAYSDAVTVTKGTSTNCATEAVSGASGAAATSGSSGAASAAGSAASGAVSAASSAVSGAASKASGAASTAGSAASSGASSGASAGASAAASSSSSSAATNLALSSVLALGAIGLSAIVV